MKKILTLVVCLAIGLTAFAQQNLFISQNIESGTVDEKGRVTFRLIAPDAKKVQIAGDFIKKFATEAEYKTWKAVLDRVVVDKAFAKSWTVNKPWHSHYSDFEMTEERYHGVSMFVPQDPKLGYYYEYNEDIKIFGWYWVVWE